MGESKAGTEVDSLFALALGTDEIGIVPESDSKVRERKMVAGKIGHRHQNLVGTMGAMDSGLHWAGWPELREWRRDHMARPSRSIPSDVDTLT